jgi:hypothetical protein
VSLVHYSTEILLVHVYWPPIAHHCSLFRLACPENSAEGSGEKQETSALDPELTPHLLHHLFMGTTTYWLKWISRCTYKGRWREFVQRSAFALKVSGSFGLAEDELYNEEPN